MRICEIIMHSNVQDPIFHQLVERTRHLGKRQTWSSRAGFLWSKGLVNRQSDGYWIWCSNDLSMGPYGCWQIGASEKNFQFFTNKRVIIIAEYCTIERQLLKLTWISQIRRDLTYRSLDGLEVDVAGLPQIEIRRERVWRSICRSYEVLVVVI